MITVWKVYILLSQKSRKTYVGSTDDFQRRFVQHNNGEVKSTKFGRPWVPIYLEFYPKEVDARLREQYLKSSSGRRYLKTVLDEIINKWAFSSVG